MGTTELEAADLQDDVVTTGAAPEVRRIAAALLPDFYAQVKRMARRERARVGGGDTLQTTALAHEAWLRLRNARGFADEAHLLRAAAIAMRHALINHAVARRTQKRGAGAVHVTLSHAELLAVDSDDGLIALNDALQRLAAVTPRLADVVECRFFAGYGEEETASALGISLRTAQRDWLKARAWLYREPGRRLSGRRGRLRPTQGEGPRRGAASAAFPGASGRAASSASPRRRSSSWPPPLSPPVADKASASRSRAHGELPVLVALRGAQGSGFAQRRDRRRRRVIGELGLAHHLQGLRERRHRGRPERAQGSDDRRQRGLARRVGRCPSWPTPPARDAYAR